MILEEEPWHRLVLEPHPGENFDRVEMMIPVLKDLVDLAQFNDSVEEQVERSCGLNPQCIGSVSLTSTEWGASVSVEAAAIECDHPNCPLEDTDFGGGSGDPEPRTPTPPSPVLAVSLRP